MRKDAFVPATAVGIAGADFTVNGRPTYGGRRFAGRRIEGLPVNVRAVQATFDDANPDSGAAAIFRGNP
jgi:hypothetical protein